MFAMCDNSLTYSYVKDEILYPGWINKMYTICINSLAYSYVQDGFLCPGWIYEMFAICNNSHTYILMSKMKSWIIHVQDESTKCSLYVIIHLLNLMSRMNLQNVYYMQLITYLFLCPRWIFMSRMNLRNVCYML